MAQSWSVNEDIFVCRYCLGYPGAYCDMMHIKCIAAQLEEAGYEARSSRSIQHRAYTFDILLKGRQLPYITNQAVIVYEALSERSAGKLEEIRSLIRRTYNPNEAVPALEESIPSSGLGDKATATTEYLRTIDFNTTFPMVLQKFLDLKKIKVYKRMCESIGLKPDTFGAILRGKYGEVKKDNVLRICVGLELSTIQSEELLNSAGYTFSNAIMLDVVVKSFLAHRVYNPLRINNELYENGVPHLFHNYKLYSPLDD